jgi:hypothetical protein
VAFDLWAVNEHINHIRKACDADNHTLSYHDPDY